MTISHLELLLKEAGVTLDDAARAKITEHLNRGAHVPFDWQSEAALKASVAEVVERGDSATVRDVRNVLKYYRTKRGDGYGIVGVGVVYDPAQPDAEAALTLVTGGRKTFRGVDISEHYRMHGVQFALQALAREHVVLRSNKGIPSSVKFGADGALVAAPAPEQQTPATGVEEKPSE